MEEVGKGLEAAFIEQTFGIRNQAGAHHYLLALFCFKAPYQSIFYFPTLAEIAPISYKYCC